MRPSSTSAHGKSQYVAQNELIYALLYCDFVIKLPKVVDKLQHDNAYKFIL